MLVFKINKNNGFIDEVLGKLREENITVCKYTEGTRGIHIDFKLHGDIEEDPLHYKFVKYQE